MLTADSHSKETLSWKIMKTIELPMKLISVESPIFTSAVSFQTPVIAFT